MPAGVKKIVNPEKELNGKKPYNRNGPGGQKKTYQAKPAKLDQGEVIDGAAALKKKLRDTLRLLSKNNKMPANIRQDHERRIEALKLQIAEKQVDQAEQKMAVKYRMIKFFESKKAERKIKVFRRQHPDSESNEDEKKELEKLELDLAYVQHYPKTMKYISLYPVENADDAVSAKAREEVREKIRVGLESGEIQQFVKSVREEVKAKIISKDTLTTEEAVKITTEKISQGKKRAREQAAVNPEDPLSARAKATAERELTKPADAAQQQEGETFFETVPKVVSAAKTTDDNDGPVKKKAKVEKKKAAAKTTQEVEKSQPKVQQPKQQQKQEPKKQQQQKKEQPKKSEKKSETPKETPAAPTEVEEQPKKLGKWARKAIRIQHTFKAVEGSSSANSVTEAPSESSTTTETAVEDVKVAEIKPVAEKEQTEKKKKPAAAEKKKPAEKKPVEKKPMEKKSAEKKSVEKKAAAQKSKDASKKKEKVEATPKEEESIPESKVDSKVEAPKITVLKVDPNDMGDSDSDDDNRADEPVVPVRKIVKVDETLLKEIPEVPKKRGGRNLNKFRKQ
ncbi:18S rRNA maturation protein [Mortierella polycephala]|uniref:rRNA-processing protein EFG1 n=1 Tax=Mortierella polycephala TaxID=41804 RepID=A0A9P6TWP2_9FUNG|nr:18S rRNA maturation protein [Mortierella polycephala]